MAWLSSKHRKDQIHEALWNLVVMIELAGMSVVLEEVGAVWSHLKESEEAVR
jgi:hypothetical protein